jgi:signal transduction histidine kinase
LIVAMQPQEHPPRRALEDELVAIDEVADAVISRARARADADETLRKERAVRETTRDLFSERARSGDVLATRHDFMGIVSHDLRNMLNTMVGFASLIEEGVSRKNHVDAVLRHAQRIQRAGARMDRLIGDLVDVASIEAGTLAVTREVGDPTPVVTEAVETLRPRASASGVSLATEIAAPSSLVAFDPARILQVLTNLLSNAIKFTPAHGSVVVRVERIGDALRFAVSDTGIGILTDQLETVFTRFPQLPKHDRRGVGLGLYISSCIVQAHGGRIWAESRIGESSTFSFTLPIHAAS